MGATLEILRALGTVAAKSIEIVVKEGYAFGKATGTGVVKGTAAVAKEVAKRATGGD